MRRRDAQTVTLLHFLMLHFYTTGPRQLFLRVHFCLLTLLIRNFSAWQHFANISDLRFRDFLPSKVTVFLQCTNYSASHLPNTMELLSRLTTWFRNLSQRSLTSTRIWKVPCHIHIFCAWTISCGSDHFEIVSRHSDVYSHWEFSLTIPYNLNIYAWDD